MSYNFPSELKYTTTHEWVDIQNSIATVGITDYAQHQLGDIVFVELPEVGMVFEKDSNAGEIESVKAVGDLIMPLSGEIIEVNEQLAERPELVNSSPFGNGWMLKIEISHAEEIDELISVEKYKELVKSEEQ
ncbi:MAG: glycine cleavage system protein GcvH [Candidatus Hermodarchaeota archaeon]